MARRGEREVIHRGRKFDFERVAVEGACGEMVWREVVRHPGAVVVVPILDGGRLALIRCERPAVEGVLWEFPAGTLEAGEEPRACALRELEEEAGLRAGKIVSLGAFYTTPGLTDELMRAFAATDLVEVGQRLEPEERIEVRETPIVEAMAMLERGELMDAKSMLALMLAERRGLLGGAV